MTNLKLTWAYQAETEDEADFDYMLDVTLGQEIFFEVKEFKNRFEIWQPVRNRDDCCVYLYEGW